MNVLWWNECLSGWFGEAAAIEQVELVRDWSQSRVMRLQVRTEKALHTVFAKQAPAGLDTEANVYRQLAAAPGFPAPAGRLTFVDGQEWLLLAQAQGQRLAEAPPEQYLKAAALLADFHERAAQADWPTAIGLSAVLPHRIAALLQTMPASVRALAASGQFRSVDATLLATAERALATQAASLVRQLAALPTTLCHGDCHSGNLFIGVTGVQLIDWGSVSQAPGLLDLVGLIDVAARMRDGIGDVRQIIDAYWSRLGEQTRQAYGNRDQAWSVLRATRALLELEWFVRDGDDYGARANRELGIIADCLAIADLVS